MKTIKFNDRIFQYEIENDVDLYKTFFYEGYIDIKHKKYLLFGKTITKSIPKYIFTLRINIESCKYKKDQIKTMIEEKIKILERQQEIERGEII